MMPDNDSAPGSGETLPPADSVEHRSQRRRLTDNIVSLYALTGLYYLIPMAVLPYLVRVLGMERYGLVAFAQSFAQYFTAMTDYGFNFSATRAIAQHQEDHAAISSVFCSVYLIKSLLTLLGVVVLVLILVLVPRFRSDWQFFSVAYLAVVGNVLFPTWYFQGIEKMRYISIIVGCARLLAAALLFVFVHRPGDALLAVGIQSAGTMLSGCIGLVMAIRAFRLTLEWPSFAKLKHMAVDGWHLFLSNAAMSLYTSTNVFIVGTVAGNVEAGYFSAAERLLRGMQGLITPVIQATFPHVSALRLKSREMAIRFASRSLRWIGGLTLIPSVIMFVFASQVTLVFFGSGSAGSIPVVRWIAFLPVLSAVSNVLGINTMIPFGLDRQFSRIVLAAGFINILLAVLLVHHYGAQGAGASILIAEVIVASGIVLALRRTGIQLLSSPGASD
jgi:polysaccharide transporter, PST family